MLEQLRELIAERLGIDRENIKPETDLQYDLGVDSLTFVSMAAEVEDTFSVSIPDEALAKITNLQDLADLLSELKKQ